jgi:predicted lipid-binding transport protein (Tim44 family)
LDLPLTFFAGISFLRIVTVAGLTCALALSVAAQTAAEKKSQSTGKASTAKSKASHSKSGSQASSAHPASSVHPKAAASAHSNASGNTERQRQAGQEGNKVPLPRSRARAHRPYKDIQSALVLVDMKQAQTGHGTPSADALRHFQQDQNPEPSGKLVLL